MSKRKMHPNSLANLNPWKKGESGNPENKPRGISFMPILDKILNQDYVMKDPMDKKKKKSKKLTAEWIVISWVLNCMKGKEKSLAMMLDRIDGAVQKNIAIDTSDSDMVDSIKDQIRKNMQAKLDVDE